jgi:predicted AAA+ superfamily ATPase
LGNCIFVVGNMFERKLYQELEDWRKAPNRKPLVIRGARQVGKTTLVHTFGKRFKQYIYINLERPKDFELFKSFEDIQQLITRVFLEKRMQLKFLSETLLFIDEIQEMPEVVNQLRYFKEEIPDLAVIAAGSMLETLMGKNLSFPVGRVEYKVLRPVSFEEYLMAMDEQMLLEEFHKTPIEKYAEPALFKAFHTYAILGGMPEVIQHYQRKQDLTDLGPIYDSLINSYLDDAEKYAKNDSQLQLIRFGIQQAMLHAGHRISFQGFGNSNYSSKSIAEILRAMEKTHLLQLIYPCTSTTLPLQPDYKKTPRIQFLDTGLLNFSAGIQKEIFGTKDLSDVHKGTIIEHLVGQELLSVQSLSLNRLQFWVREKKQSDAEIDFLYAFKGKLVPIEVKSGASGKLKSLHVFMEQSTLNFAIRFYGGTKSIDKIKTASGKVFYLLSLPYFLCSKIESYIKWLQNEIGDEELTKPTIVEEAEVEYVRTKKVIHWTLDDLKIDHFKVLAYCTSEPAKGKDILENALGLSYQSRNKQVYLKPLLDLGLIEYTDNIYLKSKQQKYRITIKGNDLLINHKKVF